MQLIKIELVKNDQVNVDLYWSEVEQNSTRELTIIINRHYQKLVNSSASRLRIRMNREDSMDDWLCSVTRKVFFVISIYGNGKGNSNYFYGRPSQIDFWNSIAITLP